MPLCTELPVVSDISEARAGNQKHKGDNIPGIYRAPEVILGMDWDCKVDIWSIGTIVICIVILSSENNSTCKTDRLLRLGTCGR
jgi:serine/threonine protein kinase